ncbi:MAG: hypothetical protein ACOH5I_23690 [Oligoflexus sp.]
MEVKTFEAFTMKDAVKAVKNEFGHDAVILRTTERVSADGRGKVFEVMASPSGSSYRSGANTKRDISGVGLSKDDLLEWQRSLKEIGKKVDHLEDVTLKREHLASIESGLFELRSILGEVLSKKSNTIFKGLDEDLSQIARKLQVMDVGDLELMQVIKYLSSLPVKKDLKPTDRFEYYQVHAIKWMMKRIKIAPLWNPVMGERQVQVLVGPSGVGKSTTVAKLAAKFFLKEEKNVIILSHDNQRLGATEQMRIFAKVIGVPFESVSRLDDLEKLLSRHEDKDLILLDTAGRSPKNKDAIEELKILKSMSIAVNYHLVLSVTDKKTQIERSIKGFNPLGIQSLIFTKLDESWSYGEIFNAGLKWDVPLSYFGIGQHVPEDLERASRERVVERIFGL